MKPIKQNYLLLFIFIIFLGIFFSCGESQSMRQIKNEIIVAEKESEDMIDKSKVSGYVVDEDFRRQLEIHSLLVINYFQLDGDIKLEMIKKLIEYLEFYRENSDYIKTDPSFQAYLPLLYGIQASLIDNPIIATESAKQSLRGFEELLEDYPQDLTLNIYYAIVLGNLPRVFKARPKAWKQYKLLDSMLQEAEVEDSLPPELKLKIYRKAAALGKELEPNSKEYAYFLEKLKKIEMSLRE